MSRSGRGSWGWGLVLGLWAGAALAQGTAGVKPEEAACRSVTAQTCAVAGELGRGVNFGQMLEAPREGDWGLRVERDFIEQATARFSTIRLPVRWSNHAALTEDARLDEFFARRVDDVVDTLLAKGVYVILDFHGYQQLNGEPLHPREAAVEDAVVEKRFIALWRQLAVRYANRSPKLVFELFNEPGGPLNGAKWNQLGRQALAVIRESNPDRVVMFGPSGGNHSRGLASFSIPKDPNLIVPVHNYDPFNFTHQGIPWNPVFSKTGLTCCDAGQRKQVTDALDTAQRWSRANGYPVTIGEFGTYQGGEVQQRATYLRFFRDEAEKRGFSWQYWEFAGGFGVYSPQRREWIEPLRAALLE